MNHKDFIMGIFKKLSILCCINLCTLYPGIEESIRTNETIISALQSQLDSMQSKGEKKEAIDSIQFVLDEKIQEQNKLLEQKVTGTANEDSDAKLRRMIQEELAKAGIAPKPGSPYDTTHVPTPAELTATNAAQKNAPVLPEQKSEAMAQYELALELYNKKEYRGAMASFSRIIKTYKTDPIAAKAMVHLAYCFEKQDRLEDAAVICNAALQEKLDEPHQVDCQFICLKFAKSKGNEAEVARILKSLKSLPLNAEQQKILAEIQGSTTTTTAPVPAKTLQPNTSAKASSATAPSSSPPSKP
jgi:TolA-binding protein